MTSRNRGPDERKYAIRLLLESYKGNLQLCNLYKQLMQDFQTMHGSKFVFMDLKRVEDNLMLIEYLINKLPNKEREFLTDIYIECELSLSEVIEKYGLSISGYRRYCEKLYSLIVELYSYDDK